MSKALDKARRVRAANALKNRRALIAEVLKAKPCNCGITPSTTDQQLHALGGGCTMPWYACPTLDSLRRRLPNYEAPETH